MAIVLAILLRCKGWFSWHAFSHLAARPSRETWPLESGEVSKMGIHEELQKQGYVFEYERPSGEDRIEVWTNQATRTAVRIEWIKIDEDGWRR